MFPYSAQEKIDVMQALYREWLALQDKIKQAQQDIQRSAEIMHSLKHFYFEGEYRHYFDAIENGLPINLHTEGEYSVMAEDTLWNAFHEQEQMLWQQLRFAVAHLDKNQ